MLLYSYSTTFQRKTLDFLLHCIYQTAAVTLLTEIFAYKTYEEFVNYDFSTKMKLLNSKYTYSWKISTILIIFHTKTQTFHDSSSLVIFYLFWLNKDFEAD